ncbi:sensor histidine kinase [Dethiobacter alkaliphilus]|uniref:sensor histidine kinase n=1 Tax=Dethiobacter alkaliphilus TaxID=427926 RepID=UPI002226C826|nr:sensor histidine kinase [Dethiobacter alkaliphilus]MCW3489521.1 sensor histidine kinase [Dethiobacter alkaliphilus]
MRYIMQGLFLLQLVYLLAAGESFRVEELLVVLLLVGVYVVKERFWQHVSLVVLQLIIVTAAVYAGMPLAVLYALLAFDFSCHQVYMGVALSVALIIFFSVWREMPLILLLAATGILAGYILQRWEAQYTDYCKSLDDERRLRYSLEEARNKLMASAKETAHLAEVKERNRIAREIHDSIGHSIAGVLIQMQVAGRLVGKDDNKAKETLQLCTEKLADALTVARQTVYNLKPRERLGIEYIKRIIKDYTFCPVEVSYQGDFDLMPAEHLETTAAIIKEALTNTVRYSKATQVVIELLTNEKYTRLLVKDNGIGCEVIREGMGISGMKERVRNLGGNLSISCDDGFMIVCMLYRQGGA